MDKSKNIVHFPHEESPTESSIPPLIKAIEEKEVDGFDDSSFEEHRLPNLFPNNFHPSVAFGIESAVPRSNGGHVSISMPASPSVLESRHTPNSKKVNFSNITDTIFSGSDLPADSSSDHVFHDVSNPPPRKTRFYSQPMPKGSTILVMNEASIASGGRSAQIHPRNPNTAAGRFKDRRFDSFKTWSGKFERQLSKNLRGKHRHDEDEQETPEDLRPQEMERVPVDRYFDALEGPELETLRASEEIILPEDKRWPFLLRFPVSAFSICLGVGSQAVMWKSLATSPSTKYLHVSPDVNLVLWITSVALIVIASIVYALKMAFYFEAVRREYYHPIRVNYFFAPWIALLLLAIGVPPSITERLHQFWWYILMAPILLLELKIYGQWMSGGQRRLSKVANPTNHLSIVGNFVGALLGASMGLKEGPVFFFAIGLAHYLVLFVTLYQRLPTNETLPKELHPVFFLFVAAPSVASMAWANIEGSFGYGSRMMYFIALFLYSSLAVRVNFFRGFKFSLAWWAYTIPMTAAATATVRYSTVVTNAVTKVLTVVLCVVSALTISALLVSTVIHALVLGDLFPNDIAIAISDRKPIKTNRRWFHRRGSSSSSADDNVEQCLKYLNSDDGKDIEASVGVPTCSGHNDSSVSRDNASPD